MITLATLGLFGWSPWSSAVLLSIILFFILAMANKWLPYVGVPFNQFASYALGILPCLIIAGKWSPKIGFVVGIVAGLVGGIGGAMFFGETQSE